MRVGLVIAKDCDVWLRSVGHQFYPVADIVGCLGFGDLGMIGGDMGQHDRDDLILASAAGDVAAFASDLLEHESSSQTPTLNPLTPNGQC